MKCSVGLHPTNSDDWERVLADDYTRPPSPPDHEIWHRALRIVDLADELGFDNLWTTEHHVTPYGMIPNPLTFLSFVAGRTQNLGVGTSVMVLPWWQQPLRAAEEIAMVDTFLRGRELTIGVGRGIAKSEYDALGVDRSQGRERFREALDIIRLALREESFSYDGEHYQVSQTSMRPRPVHADRIIDNMVGAFTSGDSLQMMADAGLGMMFTGGKPLEACAEDVALFNAARRQRGLEPTKPIVVNFTLCTDSKTNADIGRKSFSRLSAEIGWHYKMGDAAQFEGVKGYESYLQQAKEAAGKSITAFGRVDDLVLAGNPDEIIARLQPLLTSLAAKEVQFQFLFADIPLDLAESSIKLFAKEVMPMVKELEVPLSEELSGMSVV
ncbi:hypothetical protein AFA91_09790 [Mycolicibacterium goodii]|uniref:Luciferase-like domain-containing protein n=1 Tax=Mycolicibacterium goodii TaxID=134601 RepID=A0A0K0X3Z2_MYCGD|nr:hypothetical protein AFA91_09790 [Mycolicibacterium goodii]